MRAIANKREDAERMYKPEGAGKGSKRLSSAHNIALRISTYNSCYYERRHPHPAEDQVHQNSKMDGEGSLEIPILGGGSVWLMAAWGARAILLGGLAALIGLQGFLIII